MTVNNVWADDFTVERAVNLGQLDSWADVSKFQWQEIDHGILDNREEMDALKTLFYDPSPKDTVGFYNQIYKARDNQYIVLRLATLRKTLRRCSQPRTTVISCLLSARTNWR